MICQSGLTDIRVQKSKEMKYFVSISTYHLSLYKSHTLKLEISILASYQNNSICQHFIITISSFYFKCNSSRCCKPDGPISKAIQTIRQRVLAIIFSFPQKPHCRRTELKPTEPGTLEMTLKVPSVMACRAVQQGSSTLCLLIVEKSGANAFMFS